MTPVILADSSLKAGFDKWFVPLLNNSAGKIVTNLGVIIAVTLGILLIAAWVFNAMGRGAKLTGAFCSFAKTAMCLVAMVICLGPAGSFSLMLGWVDNLINYLNGDFLPKLGS